MPNNDLARTPGIWGLVWLSEGRLGYTYHTPQNGVNDDLLRFYLFMRMGQHAGGTESHLFFYGVRDVPLHICVTTLLMRTSCLRHSCVSDVVSQFFVVFPEIAPPHAVNLDHPPALLARVLFAILVGAPVRHTFNP